MLEGIIRSFLPRPSTTRRLVDIRSEIAGLDDQGRHVLNELLTRCVASHVIRPGDSVFDLGANAGFHTDDFAERVGPTGMVHAFEPNPELWPHLMERENVRLWPYAVGDRLSVERFYLPLDHNQIGSLVDARDFMGDIPIKILTVLQIPIDILVEATDRPISFMKIDVERHELEAMQGLHDTIERFWPVIVFENNTQATEALLSEMNYEVCGLLSQVSPTAELSNVVAFHRDQSSSARSILPDEAEVLGVLDRCASTGSYSVGL